MSLCQRCGNELPGNSSKCPYCGHLMKNGNSASAISPKQCKKINIKIGLPTVSEALREAKAQISQARRNHIGVVKLVHGYGSTGKGGAIRVELRKELEKMKNTRLINEVVYGENFSPNRCKQLLRRFSELKNDEDLNKGNKGITLVEL